MQGRGNFRVSVTKDYLVFASAHFITFAGHRCEGLHGHNYRVRVPFAGNWREALNTDSTFYGGSGIGNMGAVEAEPMPWNDQPFSALVTLPPLGAVWLIPE